MRRCTQDDFGSDEQSIKYFKEWDGFMILCPKTVNDDGKTLMLNGAKGAMRTSSLTFRVERCHAASHCQSEKQIDDYIHDMIIQTWIVQEQQ